MSGQFTGDKPPEGAASAKRSCRLNPGTTTQPQFLYRPYPSPSSPAVRCGGGQNPPQKKRSYGERTLFQLAAPRDFTAGSPPALVSLYARANQLPRSAFSPSAKTEGDSRGLPGSRPSGPQSVARCQGHVPSSSSLNPVVPHPPPPFESPFVHPSSLVPSKEVNTKGRPTLRAPKSLAQQIYGWDLKARL